MKTHIKPNAILLLALLFLPGCKPGKPSIDATFTPLAGITSTFTPSITKTPIPSRTPNPSKTPTAPPTLPPGITNEVLVNFIYTASYHNPDFTFTSHEVEGTGHLATHVQNTPDSSGAPIYGLTLDFETAMELGGNLTTANLKFSDDLHHVWAFSEVPEEPVRDVYMAEAYVESADGTISFTPPFDATIEFSETVFTAPGTQIVTITIVPHGQVSSPNLTVHVHPERGIASVKLLDYLPGPTQGQQGEEISVTSDSESMYISFLPLKDNEPYSFTFTLQVEPNRDQIDYVPWISIGCGAPNPDSLLESGSQTGSSISYQIANVGTWTWSAIGEYDWNYHGVQSVINYNVNFGK